MRSQSSKPNFSKVSPKVREEEHRRAFQYLIRKHSLQFIFFCSKPINEILNQVRRPSYIGYGQLFNFNVRHENLRRFYRIDESNVRLRNYSNYYAEIFDYHSVNFPALPQCQILHKRKKRHYKLQKRQQQAEETHCKQVDLHPRPSVLKKLNRKTLYLEEIGVDVSNPHNGGQSGLNFDDLKSADKKKNFFLINAEVHDIFDPQFSSDDEILKKKSRKVSALPLMRLNSKTDFAFSKVNISINSKDMFDEVMDRSAVSLIKLNVRHSRDGILEDFSELISLRNHRNTTESDFGSRGDQTSGPGGAGGARNTMKKIHQGGAKTHRTINSQNNTQLETKVKEPKVAEIVTICKSTRQLQLAGIVPTKGPISDRAMIGRFEIRNRQIQKLFPTKTPRVSTGVQLASKKFSEVSIKKPIFESKKVGKPDFVRQASCTKRNSDKLELPIRTGTQRSIVFKTDFDRPQKRNSFTPVQMPTQPQLKNIKFSLKAKPSCGSTNQPESKASFKKKQHLQTFADAKPRISMTESKLALDSINLHSTFRRAVNTQQPASARYKPLQGVTNSNRSIDRPKLSATKTPSIRSNPSLKTTKLSNKFTKGAGKATRNGFIDEYDYFNEDHNSGDKKRLAPFMRFSKKESHPDRPSSKQTSADNRRFENVLTSDRNSLQTREKGRYLPALILNMKIDRR